LFLSVETNISQGGAATPSNFGGFVNALIIVNFLLRSWQKTFEIRPLFDFELVTKT